MVGLEWILTELLDNNVFLFSGAFATLGALSYGLWSFRKGDKKMSQYMMRTRIVAQGFTITALIVGIAMGLGKTPTLKPKE